MIKVKLVNGEIDSKDLNKIQEKLNQVQSKCRARLFDLEEVISTIKTAQEDYSKNISGNLNKKYFNGQKTIRFMNVARKYIGRAETTKIEVIVSKTGKIEVDIYRCYSKHVPYGYGEFKTIPNYL